MRPGHLPLTLGALSLVLLSLSGMGGQASASPPSVEARATDLARIAAGEAGLQTQTSDMAGVHAVLLDRAKRQGWSYRTAARMYASKHFDRGRTDRRRWVAWLRRDLRRPEGWPRHLSWSAHRQTWGDMLVLAGQYVRGELEPCQGAQHWGSRADLPRFFAAHPRAEVVDCGDTLNHFLRLPTPPEGSS